MSTRKRLINQAIFLSAIAYQAVEQLDNKGLFIIPEGFSIMTTLGNKQFPYLGFIIESKKSIIISFRGTQKLSDIVKDVDIFQTQFPFVSQAGKTHQGFTEMYRTVVREPIMAVLQHIHPDKKIYLTGHSLGGALVTLCALDIVVNTSFKNPIVYTFGSPRVGDPVFATVFNQTVKQSIRIVNKNDIIPYFPPLSSLGIKYRHVKKGWMINLRYLNLVKTHKIERYFQSLCSLDSNYCQQLSQNNFQLCPSLSSSTKTSSTRETSVEESS